MIYVHNLANVKCKLKMFSDDTCLFVVIDNPTFSGVILKLIIKYII